ncbi:TolC family protein [Magnetovibrio sp. PR-2]|uniref:TolC family protein n=1 Tax=Magnetovibrio sp. PR-2 TaxID=3120356 RepID=UPI002FCE58BD
MNKKGQEGCGTLPVRKSSPFRAVLLVGVALGIAGCTVKPDPLSLADHAKRAEKDVGELFQDQEPITGPITLEEAMARAIKYNLDHRLKVMENALASHQLTSANLSLLPNLTARAGYTGRNNHLGSNSVSLSNGSESLESSGSSDRDLKTADLTLTWNILDLGMSYVRAQQQADRMLITQERRRTVLQTVIQNVRVAYWNAVSAERLLQKIGPLTARVNRALDNARKAQRNGSEEPLSALRYRRDLLDALRQLKVLRRELNTAKYNLAALMNLKVGTNYKLDARAIPTGIPPLKLDVETLEKAALLHRPELRVEGYQDRISHKDVRLQYMDMIPGIEVNTAWNFDSNSYAWEQNWFSWGSTITSNLFDVFTGPQKVAVAKARTDVVKVRRMALSMAVMSQVHVAVAGYSQAVSEYKTANELNEVELSIFDKTQSNVRSGQGGERTTISAELDALLSELRRDIAFAEMRNSVGRIYVSVGADPLPDAVEAHDLGTLSKALKVVNEKWFTGTIELPVAEAQPEPAPRKVSEVAPAKTQVKAPVQTQEQASLNIKAAVPAKAPLKAPVQTPAKAPVKTPVAVKPVSKPVEVAYRATPKGTNPNAVINMYSNWDGLELRANVQKTSASSADSGVQERGLAGFFGELF